MPLQQFQYLIFTIFNLYIYYTSSHPTKPYLTKHTHTHTHTHTHIYHISHKPISYKVLVHTHKVSIHISYTSYKLHLSQSAYTHSPYILQTHSSQTIHTYFPYMSQNIYISHHLHISHIFHASKEISNIIIKALFLEGTNL